MLSEAPTSSDWKCHQKGCKRPHWKQTFLIVVSLPYIWSCYPYGIVLCRLGFPDVRAGGCQIGVVTIACITGALWAKRGERGISRSATRARRGEEKTSACYQSIVLALPTFTSLHGYVPISKLMTWTSREYGMFVWNGAHTVKFRFKLKIKQKKCSNLLLKRKDVLRLLPAGFGKSLIYQLFPTVSRQWMAPAPTRLLIVL